MLKSIITYEGDTLLMDFPCRRMLMAEHLASIEIRTPAHEIRCADEENEPIKVKIYGTSEFENRLASFVSSENTLSFVNTICEIYHNLPYANKLDMMEAVLNGKVSSFEEFGKIMLERRMADTTEHYYCPLTATLYPRNEYGDLENFSEEYDGEYLAPYEENIRELIQYVNSLDDMNVAEYFCGSNSAVAKLKEVHFSTQNVSGVLYGCIRAELTESFTPEEDAEFKEWLEGQCSDGYGESLEQKPIHIRDGELFVNFWNDGEDYFLLKGEHSGVIITGARAVINPDRENVRQQGRRMKEPDEPMFTLTAMDKHGVEYNGLVRRLMSIECFRLQGFSDEQFYKLERAGIPESQLYKMAGNSVTTTVVTAIGKKLIEEIKKLEDQDAKSCN